MASLYGLEALGFRASGSDPEPVSKGRFSRCLPTPEGHFVLEVSQILVLRAWVLLGFMVWGLGFRV